jgi:acetyl-CoA synthetase
VSAGVDGVDDSCVGASVARRWSGLCCAGDMSRAPLIEKDPRRLRHPPNLPKERPPFSWDGAARALDGLPDGGLNICHEAVDRHVAHGRGDKVALRFLRKRGGVDDVSYRDLAERAGRFASVLETLGVARGEAVFSLLGRQQELYVAVLGTLKAGRVFCPLFSAFGPEPIATRLDIGDGRVLVTTQRLYERKVKGIRDQLPKLAHVILVPEAGVPVTAVDEERGVHAWEALMAAADPHTKTAPTTKDTPSVMHFTSGTTGMPKGAMHVHGAVWSTTPPAARLDLHPTTSSGAPPIPGWVTGTSYGIIAPLTRRDVDRRRGRVRRRALVPHPAGAAGHVWYTAPTAMRMLMKAGAALPKSYDLSACASSPASASRSTPRPCVGAARPRAAHPRQLVADRDRRDHDRQLRRRCPSAGLDGPAAAGHRGGHPAPRHGRRRRRQPVVVTPDDRRASSPCGPAGRRCSAATSACPSATPSCFVGGWYLTGDLARRDADGYFWFVGRADDVIKSPAT